MKRSIFITNRYITRLIDNRINESRTQEELYKNNFNARVRYKQIILKRKDDYGDYYWCIIGHDDQELMRIKEHFITGTMSFKSLITRKEIVDLLY
jgi:hypothetical protein